MKKYYVLILLLLLSLNAFAQGKALVIGNSRYGKDSIPTSLNDSKLAADALEAINYEVTHLQNQDYEAMLKAIEAFKTGLGSGDAAVFYFAGFTKQEAGVNYLVPNTDTISKSEKLISVDLVLEALTRATNSFVFLENRTLPRSFLRSFSQKDRGLSAIRRLNKNQGFAMASNPDQELTAQGERFSIFTYSLFNTMTTEVHDFPELMQSVQAEVMSYSSQAQKPFWQSNLEAPFIFFEPGSKINLHFRLPAYRGLDGGGSYNF